MTRPSRPTNRRLRLPAALALATAIVVAGACGGDSEPVLSADAAHGKQLASDKGCTACHTANGGQKEGPTWKGLAGSTVQLADGTSVVADDAYLTRSIVQPRAQIVQGSKTVMPTTPMSEADVAALVAYIKALK